MLALDQFIEPLECRLVLNAAVIPSIGPMPAAPAGENSVSMTSWEGVATPVQTGQWIVTLAQVDPHQDIQAVISRRRGDVRVLEQISGPAISQVVFQTSADVSFSELRRSLGGLPGFRALQPNFVYQPDSTTPNDPQFPSQWSLNNTGQAGGTPDADIDAPEAWDLSRGASDVVVGVIDTGVDYNHPDLAANVWTNPGEIPGDGVDNDANGYVDDVHGYDFVNRYGDPMDDYGHGTMVAGVVAAAGNNAAGVSGVSWNSKVMVVKFSNASGVGTTAAAAEAVNYATMMKSRGVNVVVTNNSWAGSAFDQVLYDAINASASANMLFVAAAGNENLNTDTLPNYPADYNLPNIISVASTDRSDARAADSNYGAKTVDLGAPGVSILSTATTTPRAIWDPSGYASLSGTSLAAPHVSGVAALGYSLAAGDATYTKVRDAILAGGDPVASLAGKSVTGKRLNALGTLRLLGLVVSGSTPAAGSVVSSAPVDYAIDFSHPFVADASNPSGVQAGDLTVNGIAADSVTILDADSATFHFNTSPVAAQGAQTMSIAGGAVCRAADLLPVAPWTATFRYDAQLQQVVSTSPANGSFSATPLTSIDVTFNESYDPASIGASDLVLSRGTVSGASIVNSTTVRYALSGLTTEGPLTFSLAAGAVTDVYGNPAAAYAGGVTIEDGSAPFATPMASRKPVGSLVYSSESPASIGVNDVDTFTLSLDAGQVLSVVAQPSNGSTLQPTLQVRDPSNNLLGAATAASAGSATVVETAPVASSGTYTIVVSGANGTTGVATIIGTLNAAVEAEQYGGATNDTLAGAQHIDPAFITVGGSGGAVASVAGQMLAPSSTDTFAFTLAAGDRATLAFESLTGNSTAGDLRLFDDSGKLVAFSTAGPANVDRIISDLLCTTGGTYYAQVSGTPGDYTLVVTKNAAFDSEPNAAVASAQKLSTGTVVGNIGGTAGTTADVYAVSVPAGATLQLQTYTPGGAAAGEPVNNFNPRLRVLDNTGAQLALDDNSAPDGRNAKITYSPPGGGGGGGTYYVEVTSTTASATSGDYVLSVSGATVPIGSFAVGATTPAVGSNNLPAPTQLTLDFTDAVLFTSLQASDLVLDGAPLTAAAGPTAVDQDTATFTLPALQTGVHTFSLAAGAAQSVRGDALTGFNGTFNVSDAVPTHFGFSAIPSPQVAGTPFGVTVTALDAQEHALTGFNGSASLTALVGASPLVVSPGTLGFVNGVWSGNVVVPSAGANIALRADDGSGHTGTSNSFTVQPDPNAPQPPDLLAASDSGVSSGDDLTRLDNFTGAGGTGTLTFSVAGVTPGATVTLYADGLAIGNATASTSTVQITTNGSRQLADGAHGITARQTVPGQLESGASSALTVTVDKTAPNAPPAPDLQAASDLGYSATDNVTSTTTVTLDVTAGAGTPYVRLFRAGTQITSDYLAGPASVTVSSLAEATHAFTAVAVDAAGNVSPSSPALNVQVDTTVPTASFVATSVNSGSGATTFDFNVKYSDGGLVDFGSLSAGDVVVSGPDGYSQSATFVSSSPGANGSLLTATYRIVPPGGSWDPADVGSYTVTLQPSEVRDVAGNFAAGASLGSFPVNPISGLGRPDLQSGYDTGASSIDDITARNNSSVSSILKFDVVNATPGALVTVYYNTTALASATASSSSLTITTSGSQTIPDGTYAFTVRETPAGGTLSNPSPPTNITIDTTSPAVPTAPDLQAASDTGVANTDNVTSVDRPTIDVVGGAPYFRLYNTAGTTLVSSNYASGPVTLGHLADGDYTYYAMAVDAAGNASGFSSTTTVRIDTIAPATPNAPRLISSSDTGMSNSDQVTKNTSLPITLTPTDTYFRAFRGGVLVSASYQGSSSYTDTVSSDGSYVYTVMSVDGAGNMSGLSAPSTVVVDRVAPATPAPPDLKASSDSGASNSDDVTNDFTPTFDMDASEAGLAHLVFSGTSAFAPQRPVSGAGAFPVLYAPIAFGAVQTLAGAGVPLGVKVADLNADGKLDLCMPDAGTRRIAIYLGNGDGTFQTRTNVTVNASSGPQGLTVGDLNGDGKLDLIIGRNSDAVSYWLGNGDGTFGAQVDLAAGNTTYSVSLGDFNGDGRPDIVAANRTSQDLSVYLNNGNGTFQPQRLIVVNYVGYTFVCRDFNGDGKVDIALAGGAAGNIRSTLVLISKGDGTFQSPVVYSTPGGGNTLGLDTGDFNHDGRADLVECSAASTYVLLGNTDGTFQSPALVPGTLSSTNVSVADMNGDGELDLVELATSVNQFYVALGNGDGTFLAPQTFTAGSIRNDIAVGDFNRDGKLDVAQPASVELSTAAGAPDGSFTFSAWNEDVAGNASATSAPRTVVIDTVAPTSVPNAPDLQAASDLGSSSTDNLTSATSLNFDVSGVAAGDFFRLFRGTSVVGPSYVAAGSAGALTAQPAGTWSYSAAAVDLAGNLTAAGPATSVTIDTTPPTADVVDVSPDPRQTSVSSVTIVFTRPVTGFDVADLTLTRNGANVSMSGATLTSPDGGTTFVLGNLAPVTSTSGTYVLRVVAAGSGIADVLAGNPFSAEATDTWTTAISLPAWVTGAAAWDPASHALTVTGAATIVADPGPDVPVITANGAAAVLTINPTGDLRVHVGGLTLTGGASATVTSLGATRTATNHRLLVINGNTLAVDADCTLDLADNDLLLNYAGASPAASVEGLVSRGFGAGGDWLGKGITSSVAAAPSSNGNYALGVAENSLLVNPFGNGTAAGPLFVGETVDSTCVLVKFTNRVDLDLNGLVDGNDAAVFNGAFSEGDGGANWMTGDVDFDGLWTSNDAAIFNSFYDESLAEM